MGHDDRALLPFEGDAGEKRLVRRQWREGRRCFSVVDVVAVLTDSNEGFADVYVNG